MTFTPEAILSLIATGWLNCRLFRYDALAEHASREEYRAIKAYADARFFTLGLIMAALQWIPVVNLVAPVYAGLFLLGLVAVGIAILIRLS